MGGWFCEMGDNGEDLTATRSLGQSVRATTPSRCGEWLQLLRERTPAARHDVPGSGSMHCARTPLPRPLTARSAGACRVL